MTAYRCAKCATGGNARTEEAVAVAVAVVVYVKCELENAGTNNILEY